MRGVGRLAHQIEFVVKVLCELGDDFTRLQAPAVAPEALEHAGGRFEQGNVVSDDAFHARTQDLDRHLVATVRGVQAGEVNLSHRRAGYRRLVELGEHLARRPSIGRLDLRVHLFHVKRWHPVLQLGQFVGNIDRQQIAARRQHLPELDEDRPQVFQEAAQAHRVRLAVPPPEMQGATQRRQATARLMFDNHLVDTVATGNAEDLGEAEKTHGKTARDAKARVYPESPLCP